MPILLRLSAIFCGMLSSFLIAPHNTWGVFGGQGRKPLDVRLVAIACGMLSSFLIFNDSSYLRASS